MNATASARPGAGTPQGNIRISDRNDGVDVERSRSELDNLARRTVIDRVLDLRRIVARATERRERRTNCSSVGNATVVGYARLPSRHAIRRDYPRPRRFRGLT